ncbi:Serine/threonine-protein kinase PknB [Maioricimonas rarisocia]|uniref:Serine/threonine-protein kinase PknB n=1 Tax=Maioricimonas rarisocia TaxID=2528026 RepID=A0A517Z2T8_9PLAN|nr:serine/threonine-protein kinase [Maioricimonas rarisocia]QDU36747.1 Serine/threonine-protein kinase PknB [Maioricimonas rarisocia]
MNFFKQLFRRKPRIEKIEIRRRFDLIGRVGQGSMSKVWRATDTLGGRMVALKVLDKAKTLRLEQRFVGLERPTEGEIAINLHHPNIVRTLEHGITSEDEQFLVMEFVEGVGLSYLVDLQNERMQKNRLWYIIQIGEALEYLHQQNWIHRDLCPRNIIVSNEDRIKLIDFGLVVPNTPPFRAPGNRTGTANYMAPELIKRLKTDQRIDIFSYAVTCFEMYTRELPWPAADSFESVLQHINQPPKDIRKLVEGIDEQVAAAIMKGLALHPDDRWPTTRRMVNDFREAAERLGQLPRTQETA